MALTHKGAESEGVAFVMPNDVHEKLILGFDYKSKKMSIRRSYTHDKSEVQTDKQTACEKSICLR